MRHEQWLGPIKPKVKGRPRMTKRGRAYTPQATHEYEEALAEFYDGPCFDGLISLQVNIHKDGIHIVIEEVELGRPKGITGDIDNYAKSVLDALQDKEGGMAFLDDKMVQQLDILFVRGDE